VSVAIAPGRRRRSFRTMRKLKPVPAAAGDIDAALAAVAWATEDEG
jgi:hypothetical protein